MLGMDAGVALHAILRRFVVGVGFESRLWVGWSGLAPDVTTDAVVHVAQVVDGVVSFAGADRVEVVVGGWLIERIEWL